MMCDRPVEAAPAAACRYPPGPRPASEHYVAIADVVLATNVRGVAGAEWVALVVLQHVEREFVTPTYGEAMPMLCESSHD